MANILISLRGVRKIFGDVCAVDGVDLDIGKGEIFGLIGHNGAGKSTLFKMMLGLLPATSGEIRIDGLPVHGTAFREVRRRIGYLPENVALYDSLSGLETLHFFAGLKGASRGEILPLLERVGLAQAAEKRVKGYSKGMRQRLGLAQALLGKPSLLFLDEPTNGLDPEGIREFYGILREMKSAGATIVITSHILAEIQERVDRLAILKLGKIRAIGSLQSLREQNDMPLCIEARLRLDAMARMQEILTPLAIGGPEIDGRTLSLKCRRRDKMAALEALASPDAGVEDLHVREPSLEDVLLGYGE